MLFLRSCFAWLTIAIMAVVCGTMAPIAWLISPGGRLWFACARLWGWSFLTAAGIRVVAEGPELSQPFVFAANHESLLDIPALLARLPHPARFMAKKILFHIPFVGWNMRLAGFVPIDRANRRGAARALEKAARAMSQGNPVLVFPEETRSPDGILLPFQRGGFLLAMKAGIPIVPLGIEGSRQLLRKGGLAVRPGTIVLRWGEAIPTADLTRHDRDLLIQRVRGEIQRLRGGGPMAAKDVAEKPGREELREAAIAAAGTSTE